MRIYNVIQKMRLLIGMVLGFSLCHAKVTETNKLPTLTWNNSGFIIRDSVNQVGGHWVFHLESVNQDPALSCQLTRFQSEWEASRAWQEIPGDRSLVRGSVSNDAGYSQFLNRDLLQCQSTGQSLLSHQQWLAGLRWEGIPIGGEPGYSRIFLQQNRLENTGFACPADFLGVFWKPPTFGMKYLWLNDTLTVFLAGPQDSVFVLREGKNLGLSVNSGDRLKEGVKTEIDPSGMRLWWRWGKWGWVRLEGCNSAPACSLWVEKQYSVLKIFERDGFFSPKNAIGN